MSDEGNRDEGNRDDDGNEGFFGRWIKRKTEATRGRGDAEAGPSEAAAAGEAPADAAPDAAPPEEPPFDLSKLPGLDEITAETNLADFMRKEVPAMLRNAALRRAWALDPAIRDYVNPAREYAYDWNAPGGVPGNGPIEAGFDALKQFAQTFQPPTADHTLGVREGAGVTPPAGSPDDDSEADAPSSVRMSDMNLSNQPNDITTEFPDVKSQPTERGADVSEPVPPRRRHGGAAPV